MRKLALTVLAAFAFIGWTIAAEVTFLKWDADKNELTVKEGDKEVTYKVSERTKAKAGDREIEIEKLKERWVKNGEKMSGKTKYEIKVEKDEILEIKSSAKKKDKQ